LLVSYALQHEIILKYNKDITRNNVTVASLLQNYEKEIKGKRNENVGKESK